MSPHIAVIGKERMEPENPEHQLAMDEARELGRLLAQQGAVILTGGLGGIMAAVSEGAAAGGGISVGLVPLIEEDERSWRQPNPHQAVCIQTGLGQRERMPMLILSSAAVVVVSGGQGAWIEAEIALRAGLPVTAIPHTGGTAARLVQSAPYAEQVLVAANAAEAVRLTFEMIEKRRKQCSAA